MQRSIDYMRSYQCIKKMVLDKQLTKNFKEVSGFSFTLKSDYNYFIDTIQRYVALSEQDNCIAPTLESYEFSDNKPLVVKSILQKECLELIQRYYRETIVAGDYLLGDKQSKRYKMHNEPISRFIQFECLPLIEKITGKKLRPTYTYLSSYINKVIFLPIRIEMSASILCLFL